MKPPLKLRVAQARLEAALIQTGVADYELVAVPVLDDEDPQTVLKALKAVCADDPAADAPPVPKPVSDNSTEDAPRATNTATLQRLYRGSREHTHAVVPGALVDVPAQLLAALDQIAATLPRDNNKKIRPAEAGFTLGIRTVGVQNPSIFLRIDTAVQRKLELGPFAGLFSSALEAPILLEVGMLSKQQAGDEWAHSVHKSLHTGMSIGSLLTSPDAIGASQTIAVRPSDDGSPPPSARAYYLLTAAHAFFHAGIKELPKVQQPANDTNDTRTIGTVDQLKYSPGYNAFNFIDAALVKSHQSPSYSFGKGNRHDLGGVWTRALTGRERTYVYGATSGLVEVRIEPAACTNTTILSLDGKPLMYRDMLEVWTNLDSEKPPTRPGDSGAALLVQSEDKFYVAGMIVGGGGRQAKNRHPRSFAVPIGRLLDIFLVQPH